LLRATSAIPTHLRLPDIALIQSSMQRRRVSLLSLRAQNRMRLAEVGARQSPDSTTSRRPVPWLPGRAGAVLADGLQQPAPGDTLPSDASVDRALVLASRRPVVLRVWACPAHLAGLTGLRQFGGPIRRAES